MRFVGLLATAALLAVFATAVVTFMPERGDETALVGEAPAATPAASGKAKKAKARKPKLTAAQRRDRRAAIGVLRDQGYRPLTLADYKPANTLRVLVGRGEAGQRAFFFARARYLGNDAADDSRKITVARAGARSVALSYKLYRDGDKPCCPKGKARILFRLSDGELTPQTAIPPSTARRAPLG